ncbi:MAG: hypothetical protein ABSF26_02210 [Thermoguttaceae bacterium]|jgi:ABC-type proline/glycine betaine transport system substrate-binding protein
MKKPRSFDCVEMKNAIQAQFRKEHEGLSGEEIERRRRAWLETSDDRLGKWWRSHRTAKQPS